MNQEERERKVIAKTRIWVEKMVIGLNLCPFARQVLFGGKVRFVVSFANDPEILAEALISELLLLTQTDIAQTETTLLIVPELFQDFSDYLDFLGFTEVLLEEMDLDGILQVASFHPDYQFEGTSSDDPANYTNRSPYPMFHLLREESVSRAVETYPDTDEIPERNVTLLREMGMAKIRELLGDS